MAPRLDMSANVLQNKVSLTQTTHKLALHEAMKMQHITQDYRILHAMADELNHVAIPLPNFDGISDMELLDAYMDDITALGEFTASFQTSIADGSLTQRELDNVEAKSYEFINKHVALMSRLRSMVVAR